MAVNQQCDDQNPHGPHDWYGPNPNGEGQIQYHCNGR